MAKVMMKATRLEPMNWRVRKRPNSTIGAATRSSMATNTASPMAPPTSSARIPGEPQPQRVALDQGEDDRGQARGQRDHARVVDPAVDGLVARLGDREERRGHGARQRPGG